jgi:hypothetical protein
MVRVQLRVEYNSDTWVRFRLRLRRNVRAGCNMCTYRHPESGGRAHNTLSRVWAMGWEGL